MLNLKRLGAVVAAAALSLGVATSASPASASTTGYGSCSIAAPKTLSITSRYKAVSLGLGSDCINSGVDYASWDLYHPTEGWNSIAIFDGTTSDIWDVYDWDVTPGSRYTWRPSMAYDLNYDDIAQNSAYTDVKLGSYATLATSRSGSYVTLYTKTARYSADSGSFVRWAAPRGTIQYYGSKGWTYLRYAYQNTSGTSSYKVYAPKGRSYRVVFPSSTIVWGATTKGMYR
ncbi:hypothetical protein GCM10025782_07360 [Pedococcus ginsenosidimutans]|uniref:Surface layer protein A domain-containing protein n=1 Tax=Pedococcus ginsenosidimutans TaxID=490570 RepID=A0ABP8XRW5_9MICO